MNAAHCRGRSSGTCNEFPKNIDFYGEKVDFTFNK